MRRLRSLVLAAALLPLAACGGEDGPDAEAERQDAGDALAAFEDTVVGEGFESAGSEEDEGDDLEFDSEECRELDRLLDDDEEIAGQTAEQESDSFERSDDAGFEGIQAKVTFADEDALDERLDQMDDARVEPCLEEGLRNGLAESAGEGVQLELSDLQAELTRPDDLGDAALRITMTGEMAAEGIGFPFVLDVLSLREGRRGVTLLHTAFGEDPALQVTDLVDVLLTGEPPAA